MLEPSIQTALRESVVEVLEKMFFISAFEEPRKEPSAFRPCLAAHVDFDGDLPGSLTLRTTCTAARSIAADFLGENPEALSPGQVEEVVCELANMICGAVLTRVESRSVFRLGSPQIVPADAMAMSPAGNTPDTGPAPACPMAWMAEIGGALMVMVHTEGPACTVVEEYAF